MPDVFSKQKRSEVMSRIKGRGNKDTELAMIRVMRKHHIAGWRRKFDLFGNPDFVFPKQKVALFVDGCFWHMCPKHFNMPQNNKAFWEKKLLGNKVRDVIVARTLKQEHWKVVRIWEHEFASPEQVVKKLVKALQN